LNRYYYAENASTFIKEPEDNILAALVRANEFDLGQAQRDAWLVEIHILKKTLSDINGRVYFEYSIPRMGRRIDVVVLTQAVLFVIEFKVGESTYPAYAIDQVWDYALDLKNFHEGSHNCHILPVLLSTNAPEWPAVLTLTPQDDKLFFPVCTNSKTIGTIFQSAIPSDIAVIANLDIGQSHISIDMNISPKLTLSSKCDPGLKSDMREFPNCTQVSN